MPLKREEKKAKIQVKFRKKNTFFIEQKIYQLKVFLWRSRTPQKLGLRGTALFLNGLFHRSRGGLCDGHVFV